MRLGERPPAPLAAEPPLAPTQIRDPSRERQIPDPHHVAFLDLQRSTAAPPTTPRPGQHLYLELDPPAVIAHACYSHPLDPENTANVILHPLFLLARVFDNAKAPEGQRMSQSGPQPRLINETPFFDRHAESARYGAI
jgi:hypothetical protein